MSNDLINKTDKRRERRTSAQPVEADMAVQTLAEQMMSGMLDAEAQQQSGPPRMMLVLDATTSMHEYIHERRITSETAKNIADALFAKAGSAGLKVKLVVFRGDGDQRQLRSSDWYTTPEELARKIASVEHRPGWTQHCRALRHVIEEAEKQPVQQVVVVSDAFEHWTPRRPHGDNLAAAQVYAQRLRDLGVKLSFAYKGTIRNGCPLDRAGIVAEEVFRTLASVNDGAAFLFDPATIAQRFGEIAAHAVLAAKGDTAGAQLMLEHLQAIPFEMQTNVVGAQVSRCTANEEED